MNHHKLFSFSPDNIKDILSDMAKPLNFSVDFRNEYGYHYIDISSKFPEVADAILELKWNDSIKEYELIIRYCFGETMPQARAFYKNVEISSLFNLLQKKWEVSANLNLSFAQPKLMWIPSLNDSLYFDYWKANQDKITQKEKSIAFNFLTSLDAGNVIDFNAVVVAKYNNEFTVKNRTTVNINPAFLVEYRISQNIAMEKDKAGTLMDYVKDKMQEALAITGKQI